MTARPPRPCAVGDVVRLYDKTEDCEVIGFVDEVRWDKWLYGGEHRIFAYIDGDLRMYYSTRDLR